MISMGFLVLVTMIGLAMNFTANWGFICLAIPNFMGAVAYYRMSREYNIVAVDYRKMRSAMERSTIR
jgi:hypothetical protein